MWGGIGEPDEDLAPHGDEGEHPCPSWVETLKLVCTAEHVRAPRSDGIEPSVAFADALQPVVHNAWVILQSRALAAGLSNAAARGLQRALICRLSELVSRPLALLFSGDRTLADVAFARIADGRPAGSSTTKYEEFCHLQSNAGFGELLREFPVAGRLIATVIKHWTDACSEFLGRVNADRLRIEKAFGIPSNASITSFASGLSDPHRGGRSVIIITFCDDRHLVYKPRSVDIEARYQEFVEGISRLLPGDPLRRLRVLPRDGYGYVEHVSARAASGSEELGAYYLNAGRVLGLLYLLGATDCHWENMIAAGDQLLLVDAETLFEGSPAATEDAETRAQLLGSHGIEDSVLRTGMLPMWISVGPAQTIDLSALGVPGSERSPLPTPDWCFANTDDMVWGDRCAEASSPACLPVPSGEANPLASHGDELVTGFEEILCALAKPEGRTVARLRINAFRGVRRRVVVRPTRTYALLQFDALEPDVLRDPDRRALRLERLTRAYVGEKEQPRTWPILHHELTAMEDLDIPYFEGLVGSRDLFVGPDVVVQSYYEREGLQESLCRLECLSDGERSWQVRLIHGAVAAHRFEMSAQANTKASEVPSNGATDVPDAREVAQLIVAEAIKDPDDRPTWLTVALLADATRVQLGLVPPGLYDGRAGIAAFLYDCGERNLANEVMQPVVKMIDHRDGAQAFRYIRNIGMGMTGVGGLLRLFEYRREVDGEGMGWWDDLASRVVAGLSDELLDAHSSCDLVSGLAGLAAPVARMHGRSPTEDSGRVLKTVGRVLLERQNDAGGWLLAPGHPALVGLSHGASGIAVGLAEIATALNDDRYAEAVGRALDFEAEFFDEKTRNWPDLRVGIAPANRHAMRSWCHGSAGIALARLRITELLPTHQAVHRWRSELVVAVESTMQATFGAVDHLCCGNAGRAVLIRLAGQATGNRRWEEEGHRLGNAVWAAAGGDPGRCQLLLGIDGASGLRLPGLMTGLAGLGMVPLHGSDLRWVRHLLL